MRTAGLALLLSALPAAGGGAGLPPSTLAVESGGAWHTWWRSSGAPARWSAALPEVERAVRWRSVSPGVQTGELRLAGSGEARRTRVVLLRFDPRRVTVALQHAVAADGLAGDWSLEAAPAEALAAFNAGQFSAGRPWGWVVQDGAELQPPGRGPLSMAVVVDAQGRFRWLDADSIAAARGGAIRAAIQSYPVLLRGEGEVPEALRAPGRGIDVAHRDSRLAIGELRDGRVLVALTRFDGLGGVLSAAPLGPTVPELAAIMGALGCRRAVALDGGISGQLLVRPRQGGVRRYPAWRRVPLGVVLLPARPR